MSQTKIPLLSQGFVPDGFCVIHLAQHAAGMVYALQKRTHDDLSLLIEDVTCRVMQVCRTYIIYTYIIYDYTISYVHI